MDISSMQDYDVIQMVNRDLDMDQIYALSRTSRRFRNIVLNNIDDFHKWFYEDFLPYPEDLDDPRDVIAVFFLLRKMRNEGLQYPDPLPAELDSINDFRELYSVSKRVHEAVEDTWERIHIKNSKLRSVDEDPEHEPFLAYDFVIFSMRIADLTLETREALSFIVDWDELDFLLRNKVRNETGIEINTHHEILNELELNIRYNVYSPNSRRDYWRSDMLITIKSNKNNSSIEPAMEINNKASLEEVIITLYYLLPQYTVDFSKRHPYKINIMDLSL